MPDFTDSALGIPNPLVKPRVPRRPASTLMYGDVIRVRNSPIVIVIDDSAYVEPPMVEHRNGMSLPVTGQVMAMFPTKHGVMAAIVAGSRTVHVFLPNTFHVEDV